MLTALVGCFLRKKRRQIPTRTSDYHNASQSLHAIEENVQPGGESHGQLCKFF